MNRSRIIACLGVALLVGLVFLPALRFDFLEIDDMDYVAENPSVQQGLTAHSVRWAFASSHFHYWIPLTWLSFMADTDIQSPGPRGYHLTNVGLHVLNTVLLFCFLCSVTGNLWASILVALLFGLHPARIEAVAWIASRKDVLSGLFWMLGLLAYARYSKNPRVSNYAMVFLCMAVGLLAKSVLVVFPVALLLLDVWPLGRWKDRHSFRSLLMEKIPLFALALVFSVLTYFTHEHDGTARIAPATAGLVRLLQVPLNYTHYLAHTFRPTDLAFTYPLARQIPMIPVLLAVALLILLTVAILFAGRRNPALAVGWLWFVGTLTPMVGWVRVGNTDIADRFLYIPSIGLFIALVWGAGKYLSRARYAFELKWGLGIGIVLACAVLTCSQIGTWHNTESLARRALETTRNNFVAWNTLGKAMERQGRIEEAAQCYEKSLAIMPKFTQTHVNMANVLASRRDYSEACKHLEFVLDLDPANARARSNYGSLLFMAGEKDRGIAELRRAVADQPDLAFAHFNLGCALLKDGKNAEARAQFEETLKIDPNDTVVPKYLELLAR